MLEARLRHHSFAAFPVDAIIDNSTTDFDVYIPLKGDPILYSGGGYTWEKDELARLLGHGYETFWIRAEDAAKAETYRKINALADVDRELPPAERIRSIEDVGASLVKCLYEGEITEACVGKAERIARSMVDCVEEDPQCVKGLSELAAHDYYTYYHSIRVAAYATATALKLGAKSRDHLDAIALGSIFHDVGKSQVPLEIINKQGALTRGEWGLMKAHPISGYLSVRDTVLSHVSQEIVLHHHEKLDGSGYPHALGAGSLLTEVQIATTADVFDALTSSRSYQNKRTRLEALTFMRDKMVGAKLSADVFRALAASLVS